MSVLSVNQNTTLNNVGSLNSQSRTTTFCANKSQAPDTFETTTKEKKKLSKGAKWGIALGVLTAAGYAAYCLIRQKPVKLKQLAEHIDFKEAKTLEEAKQFGRKNLGVIYTDFEEKDLEVVNWINEGLVNVSNKQKGKLKIPPSVSYGYFGDADHTAAINNFSGRMRINKKYIESLDDTLGDLIEEGSTTKFLNLFKDEHVSGLKQKIEKYKNGKLSLKEKIELIDNINQIEEFGETLGTTRKIMTIINDEKAKQKLLDKGYLKPDGTIDFCGIPIELTEESLMNADPRIKKSLIEDILDKSGYKFDFKEKSSYRTIYHELGHLQNPVPAGEKSTGSQSLGTCLENWNNNQKDFAIAGRVSDYATTSPSEFAAEVFAEINEGNKLDDEVMELYERVLKTIPKTK